MSEASSTTTSAGANPFSAPFIPRAKLAACFEELRAGWWADIHDVAGIRRLFLDAAVRGNSLLTAFQPDTEKIAQYERKVLAQRYAALLHSIAGKQREQGSQIQAAELTREAG